jgi:hypothetical protein
VIDFTEMAETPIDEAIRNVVVTLAIGMLIAAGALILPYVNL